MGITDRWTRPVKPTRLDSRGRVVREHTDRWKIGDRFLATWTEAGQRKAKSFPTIDAAKAHLADVAQAQRDGTHVLSHKTTIAEYGDQWMQSQIHQRASSAEQMEIRWRLHIRPVLGHLGLRECTRQHIQSAIETWRRPPHNLAPSTIGVTYGYVAAMFKSAAQDRVIPATPCYRINLPRTTHERVIPLTTEQVLAIADRINRRYRSLVLLGAATGLRSGELRGLTVDRLRWDDPLSIRVDRQLVRTKVAAPGAKPEPVWGPPKTKNSDRTVTVDDVAAGMLRYHMMQFPPRESGLIFTGRENGPLARTSIATAWGTAIDGMDLPDRSGLHALRHYHASLLIAAGLSVTAVADRLGHQDPTETLRTYSHLWPTDEGRSRAAITAGLWR